MREMSKLSLLLALVCVICGALLIYVDKKTKPLREEAARAKELSSARQVLPQFNEAEAELVSIAEPCPAYLLQDKATKKRLGVAVEGESKNGYAGRIRLMVGFDAAGNVVDFAVLESQETPGLGTKIADDSFRADFKGLSYEAELRVTKDGGNIDAITSATISSRAACEAIKDASEKYRIVSQSSEN